MKFWASMAFSPPEHYLPFARAADEAGVHGIVMSDHIFYPRDLATPYPYSHDGTPIWSPETAWPDIWVTIGAMAAVTERLQFGTSVYIAPARDLFTVAKQVGTAAVLIEQPRQPGPRRGLDARGVRADRSGLRATAARRLDEMIPALRALWSGGSDGAPRRSLRLRGVAGRALAVAARTDLCGGHSRPGVAARGAPVRRLDRERVPDRAVRALRRQAAEQRKEAGRGDEPCEIILGVHAMPTPDVCERCGDRGDRPHVRAVDGCVQRGEPARSPTPSRAPSCSARSTRRSRSPTRS